MKPIKLNSLMSPTKTPLKTPTEFDAKSGVALALGQQNLADKYNPSQTARSQFRLTANNLN